MSDIAREYAKEKGINFETDRVRITVALKKGLQPDGRRRSTGYSDEETLVLIYHFSDERQCPIDKTLKGLAYPDGSSASPSTQSERPSRFKWREWKVLSVLGFNPELFDQVLRLEVDAREDRYLPQELSALKAAV